MEYPRECVELVVCDNGSTDGSAAYVAQAFPHVRVVALDANYGFAEGNNRAARAVESELIAFLNNDMRVQPAWLRELVAPVTEMANVACVSSKILNWNGELIDFIGAGVNFQGFGFQFDFGLRESPKDRAGRIFCPCGGAMLIRREAFLDAGGFDGDYFGFYEDTDLGWRLNLFGHDVWYTPKAVVFHRHHGTYERMKAYRLRVLYERNALFTIYKCLDDANLQAALPASLVLLNEKALRMANLDVEGFLLRPPSQRPAPAMDATAPPPETAVMKLRRVLRNEGPLAVVTKGARFLARRARRRRSRRLAGDRDFRMPLSALACYVALSDFGHSLESLLEKRRWVQARRTRSDEELLPFFYFALEPSYHDDPKYVDFHWHLIQTLGLDRRFGEGDLHSRPR